MDFFCRYVAMTPAQPSEFKYMLIIRFQNCQKSGSFPGNSKKEKILFQFARKEINS